MINMARAEIYSIIEDATMDAYDECEQRSGFLAVLEDNLEFPFTAKVVGEEVVVGGLTMRGNRILAKVEHNASKYCVCIFDIEINEKTKGAVHVAAYKEWSDHV